MIAAKVSQNAFKYLKAPIEIVGLPDVPAPASCALEKEYYPTAKNIINAVKNLITWFTKYLS